MYADDLSSVTVLSVSLSGSEIVRDRIRIHQSNLGGMSNLSKGDFQSHQYYYSIILHVICLIPRVLFYAIITEATGANKNKSCKSLDLEISFDRLKATVGGLQEEVRHFIQENEIFSNFLKDQEPQLISDMDTTLRKAQEIQEHGRASIVSSDRSIDSVSTSRRRSATQSDINTKGPRINLTQKTDLVLRKIEEVQISFENLIKKSKSTKARLRAESEELHIRSKEVDTAFQTFEQVVVIDAVNKLTQKIPAEKFIRYMHEWHKRAQVVLEKLRLRTLSYKIHLSKLKTLKIQKMELGESVDVADLEKMQIQKVHLIKELKQRNVNLIELKHMGSKANMYLIMHKKILEKQQQTMKHLKAELEIIQASIQVLIKEAENAEGEVQHERHRMRELKKLVEGYTVPSVMEYIKKKDELRQLKKETKIMQRKEQLVETGLATYTKMMCRLVGVSKPIESWFTLVDYVPSTTTISEIIQLKPLRSGSSTSLLEIQLRKN